MVRTVTETVQHADSLRAKRDRTDAQIASEYMRATPEVIAKDRAEVADRIRYWTQTAIRDITYSVLTDDGEPLAALGDLDGVTITVTVEDMTVTAVATKP